jgi:hypothetical protein
MNRDLETFEEIEEKNALKLRAGSEKTQGML